MVSKPSEAQNKTVTGAAASVPGNGTVFYDWCLGKPEKAPDFNLFIRGCSFWTLVEGLVPEESSPAPGGDGPSKSQNRASSTPEG